MQVQPSSLFDPSREELEDEVLEQVFGSQAFERFREVEESPWFAASLRIS